MSVSFLSFFYQRKRTAIKKNQGQRFKEKREKRTKTKTTAVGGHRPTEVSPFANQQHEKLGKPFNFQNTVEKTSTLGLDTWKTR